VPLRKIKGVRVVIGICQWGRVTSMRISKIYSSIVAKLLEYCQGEYPQMKTQLIQMEHSKSQKHHHLL